MELWKFLINSILPPRCIHCGCILSEHNGLCAECFKKIRFISEPMCACCGRPFDGEKEVAFGKTLYCAMCLKKKKKLLTMQRSAFIYDDFSKNLILDFKFNDKTSSAETLANMLYNAGRDIWKEKPDVLLPVPLHRRRLLQRKYNQSALLVKYLSAKTGIPADYFSLVRQQNTVPQVSLSGKERRRNLISAFSAVKPENIKNRKVVLIDDVTTTGTTLEECAKVLHKAGAAQIYALTLARTES